MKMTGRELNSTDKQDMEMTRTILTMSYFAIFLINGPLLVLNLMANIFFVFCLMTRKTRQVKQPLKILLGSMVSFTILYVLSLTSLTCVFEWVKSNVVAQIFYTIVIFMIHGNMTTYFWLMFYYCIMIVPSQQALFLWVKKNIKSVIYIVMLWDRLMFLGDALFEVTFIVDHHRFANGTEFVYNKTDFVLFSIISIHKFIGICVMMISCFATAHYLTKHMKSLAASDGSLFNPRLHSQIRVTVTGILQGVLCFLYAMFNLVETMFYYLSPYFYFGPPITFTVFNLYISGTTVNLGVGQTLFRERAVHVWKAVKKRLVTGKSSKGLRPPGNQLPMASLAIIESSGVDTAMSL